MSDLFKSVIHPSTLGGPFFVLKLYSAETGHETVVCTMSTSDGSRQVVAKAFVSDELNPAFITEWLALSKIGSHTNVLRLIGVCEGLQRQCVGQDGKPLDCTFAFISDYLPHTSVDKFILRNYTNPGSEVPVKQIVDWATDMARGLAHLHSNGLAHCDLAARNVLIDSQLRGVLCDFGLAVRIIDDKKSPLFKRLRPGARQPMDRALECIKTKTFSAASDMFSWALTVFEIATRCQIFEPFGWSMDPDDYEDEAKFIGTVDANMKAAENAGWPSIIEPCVKRGLPDYLLSLMQRCLSCSPAARPTAAAVVAELERHR